MSAPDSKKYVDDGYAEPGYFADDESESQELTIQSERWTGLTAKIIDARNATVINRLIDEALQAISESDARNSEIMQASAYLRSAKILLEAPEPPSAIIWTLIGRAADVVSLLGFFYTLFSQVNR